MVTADPVSQTQRFALEAREVVRLAIPLIVGQMTNVGMMFVDTKMAGALGPQTLGAVAIGGALWSGLYLLILGSLMIVPSYISQFDGAGTRRRMGAFMAQAYWAGFLVAIPCFILVRSMDAVMQAIGITPEVIPDALGYLDGISWGMWPMVIFLALRFFSEGISITRPTMYIGVIGLLINIPANYVLMYGKLGFPAMGATGCGYATATVLTCQAIAMVLWIRFRPVYRGMQVLVFRRPRPKRIIEILKNGVPVGFSIFIESSLFVAAALMIGTMGTFQIAAHQISINFAALVFMVPLGIAMALTVRVGNAAGRKDWGEVRRRGWYGMGVILITQLVSFTIIMSFPESIARIYTDDQQVIAIVIQLLFLAAVFQLPDGLQVGIFGALRGVKDTRIPMMLMITSYWLIGLSLSYYLGLERGMGPQGVWIGLIAGLTVAAILLLWRFGHFTRDKLRP